MGHITRAFGLGFSRAACTKSVAEARFSARFPRVFRPTAQTTRGVCISAACRSARTAFGSGGHYRAQKDGSLSSFRDFGLAEPLTRALADEKYVVPTPIQKQTLPVAINAQDVVGVAQTGTGKTVALALPILHRLAIHRRPHERKSCPVLVLYPTRELSEQIFDSFRTYGRHLRVSLALAVGGVSIGGQVRALLSGVDVLIATPGRLLDSLNSDAQRLHRVECLVRAHRSVRRSRANEHHAANHGSGHASQRYRHRRREGRGVNTRTDRTQRSGQELTAIAYLHPDWAISAHRAGS